MKRIYTGKLILFLAAASTFFSCHKEEDVLLMEEGALPMVFIGEVRSYDDNTKVGDPLSFNNGATLYVRLENGTSIVLGTATYNSQKEAWTFTYNGSIAGWSEVSAKCYYIPNYINSSRTELTLDYNYPIYSDESATMSVAPGAVTLTAHLTPHTGRLSLGKGLPTGVNRNVKLISGLSYYTAFKLNDFSLASVSVNDPGISYNATSTNYFHGYFTSKDNPSILLQYGLYQYSRSFGADTPALKAGHSGYLTVPSSYSHEGWNIVNEMEPETDEITVGDVTFKMVTIPGGSFSMGMENVTTPVHEVTLDEFQLGETEVTQGLWEAVMGKGNNPCSFYGNPNLPVETVSYWDIQVFLFRLRGLTGINFRLPTEAEWEYAARESMGSPLLYSGSDMATDVAWYEGNSDDSTHPVKQKGANGLGLYDMSGNVWEIVSDWGNGSSYPSEPQNNPRGYAWGGGPIRRGGSYNSGAEPCRIAAREYWNGYSEGSANMGFRLACGGPQYEPEMVDLGLPSGLKWASFNLGATRPVEIGYYFAWGETEPKSSYNWGNYAFMQNGQSDEWHINKYTIPDGYTDYGSWYEVGETVEFVGDNQKVLSMEDDAARALWGGEWRIPTPTDWQELRDNCNISWAYSSNETNNLSTLIVTGPNGNSIYIPATGFYNSDGLNNVSSYEYYYHSNTLGYYSSRSTGANMGNAWLGTRNNLDRYWGLNIRPVSGDGNNYSIETSVNEEEGISFGLAAVGNTSYRTFTVRNTGALPFPIKVSCEGDGFSISPSGESTIPVGRTVQYTVSFTPAADGDYYGYITLSSSKQKEDKLLALTGEGNIIESTEYTVNGVSFKMISIPGGTFNMGHNNYSNPVHQVTLDSYSMGETEVTQELWRAVMGSNPSYHQGDKLPVENVSWIDVQVFIEKLRILTGESFHLPTEAEWEYAAREAGSDYYIYSGSNNIAEVAWYPENSDGITHPVAQKKANALGLYDMTGNVLEWILDFWVSYPSEAQVNPRGNAAYYPVLRGGHKSDGTWSVYSRSNNGITVNDENYGFRLACGGGSCTKPEMVDMGLPSGLKWANFNLGATRPSEMGLFFSWGETEPKSDFRWSTYKWLQDGGSSDTDINKYTLADGYHSAIWYQDGSFIGDGLSVLETEDDAATVIWGSDWRLPSPDDFQELLDNCDWIWTERDGRNGYEATGPNGNVLFFPVSGYLDTGVYYNSQSHSYYWSSSHTETTQANYLLLNCYDQRTVSNRSRYHASSIRPVSGAGNNYGMEVPESSVDMGFVPINESTASSFTVNNIGYLPLTVTVGSSNSSFTATPSSFTLAAKTSINIQVTYSPTSVDATPVEAQFTVSTAEIETSYPVTVSAQGIDVEVTTYAIPNTQVSFKMVSVPAGSFYMNGDIGREISLDAYSIGQTEVTQELWTAVMGSNPSYHTGQANLPVENFSWIDAKVFISRLNALTGQQFRLPTEAEWEYAAKGGANYSSFSYSGGDDLDKVAWNNNNSNGTTHPVATRRSNALGLYDMSGNVWEWLEDFYGDLPENGAHNPRGQAYSSFANHRGGCYNSLEDCAVLHRGDMVGCLDVREYLGFRLAMGNGPVSDVQMVDLGLPSGKKWASLNIGASRPADMGLYFAWGETQSKTSFNWNNYVYGGGDSWTYITKYTYADNQTSGIWYSGGDFIGDGIKQLEALDDAAAVLWGNGWRMPTREDWEELSNNCTWEWVWQHGISGMQISNNGNSIFLPAGGYKSDASYNDFTSNGNYYTSTIGNLVDYSTRMWFDYSSHGFQDGNSRCQGCTIRPVHD